MKPLFASVALAVAAWLPSCHPIAAQDQPVPIVQSVGFDQVISSISPAGIAPTITAPSVLRPHGILEWASFSNQIKATTPEVIAKLDREWFDRLDTAWKLRVLSIQGARPGPRVGLVHGRLPNGTALGNLYETPSLQWDKVGLKKGVTGAAYATMGSSKTGDRRALSPGQLADLFQAWPPQARSVRFVTGSIHELPDKPFEDLYPDGKPSIFADEWARDLPPHWDAYFGALSHAGVDINSAAVDWEIKWHFAYCKLYGDDWIASTLSDRRWPAPGFQSFDMTDFRRWDRFDPRAMRFTEINFARVGAYQNLLYEAMREFWPAIKFGCANGEIKAPTLYTTMRREVVGPGATPGNVTSLKIYGFNKTWDSAAGKFVEDSTDWGRLVAEYRTMAGAVASSKYPLQVWFQDNASNPWSWSPMGMECARHAALLSGVPPILSVDGGAPVEKSLRSFSSVLAEVDRASGGIIGVPLVPDRTPQSAKWIVTGCDLGDRILWRLSYPSILAIAKLESTKDGIIVRGIDRAMLIPGAEMAPNQASVATGVWLISKKPAIN